MATESVQKTGIMKNHRLTNLWIYFVWICLKTLMSCARMRRKMLVDSVWQFFFLLIFVGLVTGLPTYAQEKSLQQDGQPAIPADELISLEIRDFDPWEHTEQSLYSTDL